MTFESLLRSDALKSAVFLRGYVEPTVVQREAIPAVIAGRDVWAMAATGSGKTLAFVLPLLDLACARDPSEQSPRSRNAIRALVLVPTRELASQIFEVVEALSRALRPRFKTCLAVGGVSKNPQMMALRGGADLLIATPGRLLDLVEDRAARLDEVEVLVLDEADRLMSLGFSDELRRIHELLPRGQCLLFSATFPAAVQTLAESLLDSPVRIDVEAALGLQKVAIEQRAIAVDSQKRTLLLRHLLEVHGWTRVLVFVASRHAADHVADKLRRAGIEAAALHGDLSQGARTQALENFRASRLRVLVATDVASRGIDVALLPAVVNYDLPRSPVDYLHRVGRTARAGESGTAVSFVTADAEAHFCLIERRHHLRLEREQIEGFVPTEFPSNVRDPHGGVKGKRKSKKDKLREAKARS